MPGLPLAHKAPLVNKERIQDFPNQFLKNKEEEMYFFIPPQKNRILKISYFLYSFSSKESEWK